MISLASDNHIDFETLHDGIKTAPLGSYGYPTLRSCCRDMLSSKLTVQSYIVSVSQYNPNVTKVQIQSCSYKAVKLKRDHGNLFLKKENLNM